VEGHVNNDSFDPLFQWYDTHVILACKQQCVVIYACFVVDRKTETGASVYNNAWDAIAYLDQRTNLWRQEHANVMQKLKMAGKGHDKGHASTTTEKVKINIWISKELSKIDWGKKWSSNDLVRE